MSATSNIAQYELPKASVDKAATTSPPNMMGSLRAEQNIYSTPYYKDEDRLYCQPSSDEQKIYEEFAGKLFHKLYHNEIRLDG